MSLNVSYSAARLSCMLFFLGPGMAYGIFTSRMPALKAQTGAQESEIGFVLLAFAVAAIIGMSSATFLLEKFGTRRVIMWVSVSYILAMIATSLAYSPLTLGLGTAAMGATFSLADVAVNVAGVEVERRYKRATMSTLHAGYNLGGLLGSTMSALFASLSIGTLVNFSLPFVGFLALAFWAYPHLVESARDKTHVAEKQTKKSRIPLFVLICGFLATIIYATEGSIAEWGSLYLFQVKLAPESRAALAYGTYSICALSCRLIADRLRTSFGDFLVCFTGSILTAIGMSLVLLSPLWQICLAGYGLMGIGMGPLVPTLFSRGSRCDGISTERATAVVSICAYSGLLVCPPYFGIMAQSYGLTASLSSVLLMLAIATVGMFVLRRPAHGAGTTAEEKLSRRTDDQ